MVYKAVHKLSGDLRAVKVVDKAMMNQKQEEQLYQEFNILRALVGPRASRRTTRTLSKSTTSLSTPSTSTL